METSAVNLREYTRIFTGTNQEDGYETPFFGFTTDTGELILKTDAITYFHYPINAPSGMLVDSTLVLDGAVAGEIPFYSDKIWKKQANYSNSSVFGNSQPIGKQTGVWLCAWLSASETDLSATPVWKDRWYNPGYIDAISALYIKTPVSGIILDIDSEMSFEGGSYYKYFHAGNIQTNLAINDLSSNNALKIYLEDWSEYPTDLSINNNKSIIRGLKSNTISYKGVNYLERPYDTCLMTDGTNYCETVFNSSISLTGSMTYNFWAKSDDWSIGNNTLLSKDNRGGYNFKVDHGFDTRFMVFLDDSGKIVFLNNEGHVIDSKTLPAPSKPTSVVIDENLFTWVSDNSAKRVYKIDYNGDILDSIDFDVTTNLQKIDLDEVGNLCVLDTNTSRISAFNVFSKDFVGVKSGLFYEAYMGNSYSSYLSGAYEGFPPPASTANIIHNGYFNFSDSYSLEKRITNNTHSYNMDVGGYITSGLWFEQNTTEEHYGLIWKGKLQVPEDGIYTFKTMGDDYLKLSANNVLIASAYYIDGQVETSYNFLSSIVYDIRLEMGDWQSLDYFDIRWKCSTIPSMSAYEDFGKSIYLTPNGSGVNNFTINLTGGVLAYDCTDLCVDNDNNNWVLKNYKIYKNGILIDLPVSSTKIAIDKDNKVWVLYGVNEYLKMDSTTFEYVTGTVGYNTNCCGRSIDFTYEMDDNNVWKEYVYFTTDNDTKVYKTDENGVQVDMIDLTVFDLKPKLPKFTSFDNQRKFNYVKNNKESNFKADLFVKNGNYVEKYTLSTPINAYNDTNWHMFTYISDKNNLKLFIDGVLRDSYSIGNDTEIYYTYENSLMLGADVGKNDTLNDELGLKQKYFIGNIDALRIYDKVLNNFSIRYLYLSKYDYNDLVWNIPTGLQSYIEEIVRFFKFKLPGQKSQYYNINLIGLQIDSVETREIIENIIKDTIKKVAPAYTELYKIVWK